MNSIVADIRFALRQLGKSPGFTLTAILTLALGIGATTAIFTLVYQVMLRSLPVSHPEQLYKVGKALNCCVTGGMQDHWSIFSTDLYRYLRDNTPGTAGIAAVQAGMTTISERREGSNAAAQPLGMRFVSGNYFAVLGTSPFAGRLLRPEDDRVDAAPAAVISYTLWQSKFARDPHLLGSTLMLTGHPVTVVGISSQNFLGERNEPDPPGLWMPLAQEPLLEPARTLLNLDSSHWLDLLVRMDKSSNVKPAELALQGALHQWIAAHAGLFEGAPTKDLAQQTTELASANSGINTLRDWYEQSLWLLLMVSGFVLLIACANLASLMLVRGMARQQELAVRSALGAPRARLVRQMLVEALVLSLLGGVAAILVAYVGTRGILTLAMKGVELSPLDASPSLPVLGFALLISLLTGVAFGIAPAWITSRTSPVQALRGANRSTRDASATPQKLLVILQAALSLVLLSTSGLLVTSLRSLEHQDFHFEPQGRLLLAIDLQAAGIPVDQLPQLYARFNDMLGRLPGVQSIAYATYTPMVHNNWAGGVFFPGVDPPPQGGNLASYASISQQYLKTLGIPLLLGRSVTEQDTATGNHVAVINQAFVRRYFKGHNPIGQHFGPDRHMRSEFEVIGVAEDAKYGDPAEPTTPMYMTPILQTTRYAKADDATGEAFKHYANDLVVHYQGDESSIAASVRQTLKLINPDIPVLYMHSYTDQLSTNFTQEDLVVRLTTLFGLLALILASIGLYGVTAYAVARRTGEIGIRMALGASRGGVLAMIVKGALAQALLGLALGLPLCFAAGRLLQHTLYQTSGFQPLVLLTVAVLLLLSALLAALIPARRAASIDPMQALRAD